MEINIDMLAELYYADRDPAYWNDEEDDDTDEVKEVNDDDDDI